MSRVDLSDFLSAYLSEVDEHLATSNAQVLKLEAAVRAGEPTLRPIRELFRALHTIKGLSSMVGVEPVVSIAHRLETALKRADRAGGRLPDGAIDTMLQGLRAIEQRVKALAESKSITEPSSSLLQALEALEPPEVVVAPPTVPALTIQPALDAKLASFERDVLARGVAAGRRALALWFVPSPERAAAGVTITTVRERLAALGEIVKVVPVSAPRGVDAPAGLLFALLVLTDQAAGDVARALGLDPTAVDLIAEPQAGPPAPPSEMIEPLPPDDDEIVGEDALRRGVLRVDVSKLDHALDRLAQFVSGRSKLAREVALLAERGVDVRSLTAALREQSRQVRDLRGAVLAIRMVPVAELLERVPLIVRGLRRTTGKAVRLELDAGRAELDKAVSERLFPAIVHLVRNAVDHAIEPPEERRRLGKPEEGLLRITCFTRGNAQLELVVEDDGRGIDGADLARRAGQEPPATDAALLALLCRPGLSSREEVSTTSGRGMGMDIVRRIVVGELGGDLEVATTRGHGTRFSMRVPLTLSIIDALTFECREQTFVAPMSVIEEIIMVDGSTISHPPLDGRRRSDFGMIERRGEAMALVDLGRVFGLPGAAHAEPKALIVRCAGEPVAFSIDRTLGQQEVVVRPLADPLCRAPGVAGATDLGDGRPTLVVDLLALGAHVANGVAGAEVS